MKSPALALVVAAAAVGLAACPGPARPPLQTCLALDARSPQQVRALRRAAFRGDFEAQAALGRAYGASGSFGRPDETESAVWYAVALTNPEGYAPASGDGDCNPVIRAAAAEALAGLLGPLSSREAGTVRRRAVYVISASGRRGFRALSRTYSPDYGAFGEAPNGEAADQTAEIILFPKNVVDSQVFAYLALNGEDGGAASGDPIAAHASAWVPPYEFYPPASPTGQALSDESAYLTEGDAWAIGRIDELPFAAVGSALKALGVTDQVVRHPAKLPEEAVRRLQALLGRPPTGRLASIEKVRAIQYAAVQGSVDAQLALGVMYAEGVGVRQNQARARRWLEAAARQGSAKAREGLARLSSSRS